jgi:hypothetical protein
MQMLSAGGIPALTDQKRVPDADNPRGYFEWELVKRLPTETAWLAEARGHAVKVVHLLLRHLPTGSGPYDVLWLRRDLGEVLASQRAMLERQGRSGAALPAEKLRAMFEAQMRETEAWMNGQPHLRWLALEHAHLISQPRVEAERIAAFLGRPLEVQAMAATVDPALHRNRVAPESVKNPA